jgi:hypothetical protein
MEFEIIENGKVTKYKYFEIFRMSGGMDLGLDVEYPDEMDKKEWYDNLIKESDCMLAATLGYLMNVGADFSFITGDAFSQLSAFSEKYFTNAYFSEPYFIDGAYGRFSDYGELAYPENDEDGKSNEFTWNNGSIRMKLAEKCFAGDWNGKIFINQEHEAEFKSQLKSLIESLDPN